MPPGPKIDRVCEIKRFPRPTSGFHGSEAICTWKPLSGKRELTPGAINNALRRDRTPVRLAVGDLSVNEDHTFARSCAADLSKRCASVYGSAERWE